LIFDIIREGSKTNKQICSIVNRDVNERTSYVNFDILRPQKIV